MPIKSEKRLLLLPFWSGKVKPKTRPFQNEEEVSGGGGNQNGEMAGSLKDSLTGTVLQLGGGQRAVEREILQV